MTKKQSTRTRKTPKPAKRERPGAHAQPSTKQERLLALLRQPDGVSIAGLSKALGWQPHTVRGVLSAVVKKKLGLTVTSDKSGEGPRLYRLQ